SQVARIVVHALILHSGPARRLLSLRAAAVQWADVWGLSLSARRSGPGAVMLLSSRLSLPVLIELCRALRHNLGAGLTLLAVFRQQQRRGPAAVRALAGRVADLLEKGHSLGQALKREANYFPPLFLSLAEVGEQTGMLPEVFA